MTQAYSPFDSSKPARIISSLKTKDIIRGYKLIYNVDISDSFKNIETIYLCECPLTSLKFYFPFGLDGDGDFYKKLSLNNWYYNTDRWEHTAVADLIEDGKTLLEIGPGDGVFLQKLTASKKIEYVGLELNLLAIEKAAEKGITLTNEMLHAHAQTHNGYYDIVCSFQVMEHISAIHEAMSDSVKALKNGGTLIIAVPNNSALFKSNIHPSRYLNMPPHHVNLFDEQSLPAMGKLYDLELKKVTREPLQDIHIDLFLYNKLAILFFKSAFLMKLIWKTKVQELFRPLVKKYKHRITGHTIIAIFEKQGV